MFKLACGLACLLSFVHCIPHARSRDHGTGSAGALSTNYTPVPLRDNSNMAHPVDSHTFLSDHPQTYWYQQTVHNGVSPFLPGGDKWKVFRNVVTGYKADNTGFPGTEKAMQNAINGRRTAYALPRVITNIVADGSRDKNDFGTTRKPAVVYIPGGTYVLNSPLQLYVGTVLIGDPLKPPILKAGPHFMGNTLIYAKDPNFESTTTFYIALKNLQLDSTNISKDANFTLLDWSVSQGTQLVNVVFNMPTFSKGHTGIAMPEGGSGTHMSNLTFQGGAIGINMNNQQYEIASVSFLGCQTGILVTACFSCIFIGLRLENNAIGIDMSPGGGHSVTLLDSTARHVGVVVKTLATSTGDHSLVIENFDAQAGCSSTVAANGNTILSGSVLHTWVYGNVYTSNEPNTGSHEPGSNYTVSRSGKLITNGKYIHVPAPTNQEHSASQVLNVKNVPDHPVHGDGVHDDTMCLNAVISKYADSRVLFFPYGTYLISSTLHFPPGSRVVGEAWSTISASGSYFKDVNAPKPMIQVGHPGEKGVAQFSDLLFTVSDILPGCILLEVNMAGTTPGDVGFWNAHLRIGGAAGSWVQTQCVNNAGDCQAAYMMVHLTASSSAYIENMWAWTADHDLDGQNKQIISTGRGMLIESTAGTWLHGTAVEHNTLYQYNFHKAQNVFMGLQQSEAPYWQGPGAPSLAPAPWTPSTNYADPDFSNCNGADAKCRMAWYNYFSGSKNVTIYGSAFWTFFNHGNGTCQGSFCQTNAAWVENTTILTWYNLNTRGSFNLVTDDVEKTVLAYNNPGSWGAVVAGYFSHQQ